MQRDFFDPPWDLTQIVLVDKQTLSRAQARIASCEACDDDAELPFDHLLDTITASDPKVTDYLLYAPATCPRCNKEVREKTLIAWRDESDLTNVLAPVGTTSSH